MTPSGKRIRAYGTYKQSMTFEEAVDYIDYYKEGTNGQGHVSLVLVSKSVYEIVFWTVETPEGLYGGDDEYVTKPIGERLLAKYAPFVGVMVTAMDTAGLDKALADYEASPEGKRHAEYARINQAKA